MVTAIADHTGGCLEALVLPQTASFTDVGLCYLLERSPALQSLSIASCSSVSDMAIMTLAKCCKRIQSLNVSRWVNHIRSFGCNVSVKCQPARCEQSRFAVAAPEKTKQKQKCLIELDVCAAYFVESRRCTLITDFSLKILLTEAKDLAKLTCYGVHNAFGGNGGKRWVEFGFAQNHRAQFRRFASQMRSH